MLGIGHVQDRQRASIDRPRRTRLRSLLLGTASLALLSVGCPASAQSWPSQPVKYIVPFPPGASTDAISRQLGEKLGPRIGQPVVVENVGGAGGSIGVGRLANAAPDGHTIGLGNSATHTITPHLLAKVPYDPTADFTAISMLSEYVLVLIVTPGLPARDMKEFLALSRSRPGGLTYASAGNGSSQHLASELLGSRAGVRYIHAPYKGGGPAQLDLVAGHIDWMFGTVSEVLAVVRAGKARALGISGRTPDPLLPGVPPIHESLPDYEVVGFQGLFGPANMAPATVNRLNSEVNAILRSPDVIQRFAEQGLKAVPSKPEELATRVRNDFARWKGVIAAAGIKPE